MNSQPSTQATRSGRSLSVNWPARGGRRLTGVVLVLHGGRVASLEPTSATQPAVLRLTWLAQSIRHRLAPQGVAVARLRFSVRGWNGPAASPVADARWAIDQLRAQSRQRAGHPVPIVIAGHSMGGRTAIRAADEAGVIGVVALAPWVPPGEPVQSLAGRRLVIAHGTRDRITDPAQSAAFAERAAAVADDVHLEVVLRDGHAMLRTPALWHRLTARYVREMLSVTTSGIER